MNMLFCFNSGVIKIIVVIIIIILITEWPKLDRMHITEAADSLLASPPASFEAGSGQLKHYYSPSIVLVATSVAADDDASNRHELRLISVLSAFLSAYLLL